MSVVVNVMLSLTRILIVRPIGAHDVDVMYFGIYCFRGELGFLNCDDICISVVNKLFELIEFAFNSVYADLKYNEYFFHFFCWVCVVCVVMWAFLVCL